MTDSLDRIVIIGAGNYGTAIAQCFSRRGKRILLISNSMDAVFSINELHMNLKSLRGTVLAKNILCTNDFSQICDSDIVFIATPVKALQSVCEKIKEYQIDTPVVLCSKGFDVENGRLQSDLFEEILHNDYAIFSGPSFANEIANGLPASVNIASKGGKLSKKVANFLASEFFKIEAIDDYIGLQVAGALKNVLAIGCGIFSGLKLGDSAIAQLIVCGLREISELSSTLGGQKETILEFGGVGDTILTCTSRQSRNVLFGDYLATGGDLKNWNGALSEGAFTANAIPLFEKKYNIKLKIFSGIYNAIYGNISISEAVRQVM